MNVLINIAALVRIESSKALYYLNAMDEVEDRYEKFT